MNLTYLRNGDYLFPDLQLEKEGLYELKLKNTHAYNLHGRRRLTNP